MDITNLKPLFFCNIIQILFWKCCVNADDWIDVEAYLCTRKRRRCPFSLVAYDLHGDVFVNGTLDLRWHPFSWWVISQCRQLAVFQATLVRLHPSRKYAWHCQSGRRASSMKAHSLYSASWVVGIVWWPICVSDRNVYPKRKKPTDTYFCNINCLQSTCNDVFT